MLSELPPDRIKRPSRGTLNGAFQARHGFWRLSVSSALVTLFGLRVVGTVLMQLPRTVRAIEFMALTGNPGKGSGKDQQEETFHRRAT